jgi:hypothetical protein
VERLAELMLIKQTDEHSGHSAVFEDDGRVAYAYLLDGDDIVADVWLYNRAATPEQPERDPSRMPFLNPRGFASGEQFPPVADESEVAFSWSRGAAGQTALRVFIRGDYHAMLVPGSKPGWCKLAARDGPLASVLREDDELER